MSNSNQEFETYFSLFDWGRDENGAFAPESWPLFRSDEAVRLVRERAASFGGMISISHFLRAFSELKASGAIRQVRSKNPLAIEPEERSLSAAQYNAMPASRIVVLYRSDESFRAGVDKLIAEGKI